MNSPASRGLLLIIVIGAVVAVILLSSSTSLAICKKTEHLFVIERNKNGNRVHYDVCIGDDDYPSDTEPVIAYWILEDGKREDLNKLERDFAYGIAEHKKLGKDMVRIVLTSMKKRAITVEKVGSRYTARMRIDGKESILDKVYVKSHELIIGLPRVQFVDLYGRTKGENRPVRERIDKP